MLGGQILHGGDYNPDQWLDCPEVLEEDVRLMKEANVNCVSLGIFAWAALEPEEGRYEFDWLEKIIDRLGEEGIQVVLATPSGAMPHWLTQKYPETMQVQADGKRNLPGKRHNFCYTSPVMREKIYQIDSALSERFGRKENVILWHLSNELGGNFADSSCHCELCQEAFRNWLKEKYGTLDNLNRAYWSTFWSHTYTSFLLASIPISRIGFCSINNLDFGEGVVALAEVLTETYALAVHLVIFFGKDSATVGDHEELGGHLREHDAGRPQEFLTQHRADRGDSAGHVAGQVGQHVIQAVSSRQTGLGEILPVVYYIRTVLITAVIEPGSPGVA